MIIYNDYKNRDWLSYSGKLPKGNIIIINNETYNQDVVDRLDTMGLKGYYSRKLGEYASKFKSIDAENYHNDIEYCELLGEENEGEILFPENLGGDKYKNYDNFIKGCNPKIVCMERTYNVWKPWDLLIFWDRNKYLRDKGIEVYIGIWPESLPKICQFIQYWSAKLISGNKIFWYSETKRLP